MPRLYGSSIVLAIVLTITVVPSARTEERLLHVVEPRISMVNTPYTLASVCNTENDIGACTGFKGRRLRCSCERTADGWQIKPSAQFIPFIYLWRLRDLGHEHEHIGDLRLSAEQYLGELTRANFDSKLACSTRAQEEEDGFADRVNQWIRLSNAERHPYQGHILVAGGRPRRR